MKFVCDRCQTRYSIADEKIRQRIVRIRCKNCGGVVTLHAGEKISGPQDASARLSSDLPAVPAAGARGSSKVARSPSARTEWFVAVDGAEKGPLSCADAAKYIASVGPDHGIHVWKEGMDEWKRPKDVAIIAQELSSLKRAPGEERADARTSVTSDATVVTPIPMAFDPASKPTPPAADGSVSKLPSVRAKAAGSALKSVPASTPKAPAVAFPAPTPVPPTAASSGPKSAPPPIPSGHRAPPPIPGSGLRSTPVAPAKAIAELRPASKSATMPVVKTPAPVSKPHSTPVASTSVVSDDKAAATAPVVKTPAPVAVFRATSPAPADVVPGSKPALPAELFAKTPAPVSVPRPTPVAAAVVHEARPAAKSATYPVVKTPAPVTVPRPTPVAAAVAVPEARPAAKSATYPVVKTPAPVTVPLAEGKTDLEPAPKTAAEPTPGAGSEFDDDVPTSPAARRKTAPVPTAATEAALDQVAGASDLSAGLAMHSARESKNWPVVANLSFSHPPAMPDGMTAEGAMALPTPAPLSGPLFANVADMPVKSLVGHAEMGLSKLTGLAGLVNKHQHLKYVAAAGVLVVLVIVVALLSLRGGDSGKDVDKVAEIEKKARAAALAANPIPFSPEQPSAPSNPVMDVGKAHAPQAHSNNKKVVAKPTPAPSPSGKPAPVENPLEPPAGMMRSTEKPIPLAAIQGKRAPAANEPKPIPREAIADVIRRKENQAGLKTCYERALKRDGRLRAGRLDITVSIGPMGSVQKVQVNGSADFMIIEGCLKEAIRHWRFPSNSEEYATSFPLILQGG
jgi:predicted Zn finger-like uncharacterized protein